jgi:hypothetical protein
LQLGKDDGVNISSVAMSSSQEPRPKSFCSPEAILPTSKAITAINAEEEEQ